MKLYYEPDERIILDFIPGFVPGKKIAWAQIRIKAEGTILKKPFIRKGLDLESAEPTRSTISPNRVKTFWRRASELIERSRGKLPIADDVEGRSITIQSEDGAVESVTLYGGGGGIEKQIKKDFDALWSDIAACTNGSS